MPHWKLPQNRETLKNRIQKIVVRKNTIHLLVFFFYLLMSYIAYKNTYYYGGDVGEYANNPLRILNGELPYRDFWLLLPPGEIYFPFFIYKIFGLNVSYVFLSSAITNACIGWYTFKVTDKILQKGKVYAFIASLLVFFGPEFIYYFGYIYSHIYFLFLFISIDFFLSYLRNDHKKSYIFWSGLCVGLALLFRWYETGAFGAAVMIAGAYYIIKSHKKIKEAIKLFIIFVEGVMVVLGLTSLFLYKIWPVMIDQIIFDSLRHNAAFKVGFLYNLIIDATRIVTFWFFKDSSMTTWTLIENSAYFITEFVCFFLPFIALVLSIKFFRNKDVSITHKTILLLLLSWSLITYIGAWNVSNIYHIARPALVACIILILLLYFERYTPSTAPSKERIIFLKLIIVILLLYIPIFIGRMKNPSSEVYTPYGSLHYLGAQQQTDKAIMYLYDEKKENSSDVQSIIQFIQNHTDNDDYIFVTPWDAPPFYALTNRKNPTYYDSMIDVLYRPDTAKQEKICSDLLSKNTKVIVHVSDRYKDRHEFKYKCPIIQRCIDENFKKVQTYDNYRIYVKKP